MCTCCLASYMRLNWSCTEAKNTKDIVTFPLKLLSVLKKWDSEGDQWRNDSEPSDYNAAGQFKRQFKTLHVITANTGIEPFVLIELNLNSYMSNCLPCAALVSHNKSAQPVKCFLLERIRSPFLLFCVVMEKVHQTSCWFSKVSEHAYMWCHRF